MSGQMPALVSVIVPVYQVAAYLPACLKSLMAQTYQDFEVIVIDDGSTDEGPAICDKYAQGDRRIRVVHQENCGLSAARNAGLDRARGEYVAFVDSDDVVAPGFIEALLVALVDSGADIAQCGFTTRHDRLALGASRNAKRASHAAQHAFARMGGREATERLLLDGTGAWTVVWNKLYRYACFEGIRFPVGKYHEDEFVTWRLLWATHAVTAGDVPLYYYRQRHDSIMGQKSVHDIPDLIKAFEERIAFYEAQGEQRFADLSRATLCYRLCTAALEANHLSETQIDSIRLCLQHLSILISNSEIEITKKISLIVLYIRFLMRNKIR